jgi:hypothetical protein
MYTGYSDSLPCLIVFQSKLVSIKDQETHYPVEDLERDVATLD